MTTGMQTVLHTVMIGVGATLAMDLWAFFGKRVLGIAPLDYALVGRWIGHFGRGEFRHEAIARAPKVAGEAAIGWAAHYAIGIAFAAGLVAIWGEHWLRNPSFGPAMAVGLATTMAPFFVLQPCLGLGVAASRTPAPNKARVRTVVTHLSFGAGLYLTAVITSHLIGS
ncbi:DUF2938 domain-containing protein [Chelatococcus sp. SYSU_G07232]|uniref:DUF2938 domain-containing protein n=1 Tax=Chelatococcus albus TaxID=3047466 RepID=A0ABT7AKJ0_9HYPH|nr:DUF2938 domain-containing protein [Chelatococcus sp. SYSU_G07232]MDJ1159891.1 DUF2938 domain-containing protein [Chelatococcus sp. SYSU_G07232]